MKCAEQTRTESPVGLAEELQPAESTRNLLTLPMGMLGFDSNKNYLLLGRPEEAPFHWLQMADDPGLAFLMISPSAVTDSYKPEISDEEAAFLGLTNPDDALVFNTVTVHPDRHATVNLKGPVVVNRRTGLGKQIVPLNAAAYSLQHPLATQATF